MDGLRGWSVGLVCGLVLWAAAPAGAELADVYLRSGLRLRADVTVTGDEIILRNAAGELRLPREQVARIVPVGAAEAVPLPAASRPASSMAAGRAGGEEEPEEPNVGQVSAAGELPAAPLLSKEDIQRLRLHELTVNGQPENVRVQFERKGRQRELSVEVLEELRKRKDFKSRWEEVLTRGQPHERLQLIVRETGLKYAERIRILSDPEVFDVYRRRVLPLVAANCARSGCHGGATARVFRFPPGAKSTDGFAYTSFVLLDQMETLGGPMIDRGSADGSALVRYMLPAELTERGHPPVHGGPAFRPALRGRDDPQYGAVVDWISMLTLPHPEYGLEYQNPYAGLVGAAPADKQGAAAPNGAESQPAGPPPASSPAPAQP